MSYLTIRLCFALQMDPNRLPRAQVITAGKLHTRPARSPDHEAENRAIATLMQTLVDQPSAEQQTKPGSASTVLHKLVETALELCRAHSAGVSILEKESGQEVFCRRPAAGTWSIYPNDVMPHDSPCAERRFPYAQSDMPPNLCRILAMSWRERNGPLVEVPRRQGFGHTIVVRTVEHALDASVVLDCAPTGVQWEFSAVPTGRAPP